MLFRLRPGITIDRVRHAREALAGLVETLPGVLHFTVTDNLAERNGGFTMALFSAFDTRAAFDVCMRHPEYRRVWQDALQPIIDEHLIATGEG